MMSFLKIIVTLMLLCVLPSTYADNMALTIIRQADQIRSPNKPFRYTVTVLEYRDGENQPANKQILDISMRFIKPENGSPADARSLARFIYPVRDKGKLLLSDWFELWFYTPELRRPVPVSPLQRFSGQISNGDVIVTNFEYAYNATLSGEETCGDKQCYKLLLIRKNAKVTWPKIIYWVEKGHENRPFKASYYSLDDKLIKNVLYENYQPVLGRNRPVRIVIHDLRHKNSYSVMEYSDIRLETLPVTFFTRSYLQRSNK
ncbi:outer membrane lipoprotein-sorting protein [Vagococcus sp. WN89Y]|uniref:outer membrane lipoprotein-sorting protein n=1 Tax=Vagococcus sp. WN89Y TaxID=3457258 RepID=UPI003FCC87B6